MGFMYRDDDTIGQTCCFCGDEARIELFEIYGPRDFQLDACCPSNLEDFSVWMEENPREAAQWLNELGGRALFGGARRILPTTGQLVIDWNLRLAAVKWAQAREFIAAHHRHNPAPAGWRFGQAVFNGSQMIGVVVVGRPVARGFDPKQVVEVTRLCVRQDIPEGLQWNACSMLYGFAAREAAKRGFRRCITYTTADEDGVSVKAAGFVQDGVVRGRSWNCVTRPRADRSAIIDKMRWLKELKPKQRRASSPVRSIPRSDEPANDWLFSDHDTQAA